MCAIAIPVAVASFQQESLGFLNKKQCKMCDKKFGSKAWEKAKLNVWWNVQFESLHFLLEFKATKHVISMSDVWQDI